PPPLCVLPLALFPLPTLLPSTPLFRSLSQKASPFGMIPLGLALSAGCNFGMGVAPAGAMPLLWAANGLFQAMGWPPIVRLFAERSEEPTSELQPRLDLGSRRPLRQKKR